LYGNRGPLQEVAVVNGGHFVTSRVGWDAFA